MKQIYDMVTAVLSLFALLYVIGDMCRYVRSLICLKGSIRWNVITNYRLVSSFSSEEIKIINAFMKDEKFPYNKYYQINYLGSEQISLPGTAISCCADGKTLLALNGLLSKSLLINNNNGALASGLPPEEDMKLIFTHCQPSQLFIELFGNQ